MSDEDTLRRAAAKVRERAAGTTQGRMTSYGYRSQWAGWPLCDFDEDDPEFAEEAKRAHVQVGVAGGPEMIAAQVPNWRDSAWIALVAPHTAEPLAAWLEDTADNVRGRWAVGALAPPNHIVSALAFAGAVLGEQVPA